MNLHDIIKIAMAEHPNDPDAVAKLVDRSMCVYADINRAENEMAMEYNRHESRIKELKQRIADVQKECDCPAAALTYHGDPSGNNDSCHECRICGKNQ